MKKQVQPLTPAALYARVSSNGQDVDLSMAVQLRALRDYAKANGYSAAREYVDEAESGRVAEPYRYLVRSHAQMSRHRPRHGGPTGAASWCRRSPHDLQSHLPHSTGQNQEPSR